jgi:hypothetical protein
MNMPFTVGQFFDVFARYHAAVWPAPLVLNALALLALVLVYRAPLRSARWVPAILAFLWAWMALAYHLAFFAAINPAAWVFATVFLVGAAWFVWVGVVQRRLRFEPRSDARGWAGGGLVVLALVVYPLLGAMLGHRYPAAPTFGLPCPTTIFTIGLLLLAKPPVPRSVLVVPVLWAAVGSTAAFGLGVYQDLALLVAGAAAVVAMFHRAPPALPVAHTGS